LNWCYAGDVPPNVQPAQMFGNYACCSPFALLQATMDWLVQHTPVDFVVWTGDTPRFYNVTFEDLMQAESMVVSLLQTSFPSTAIFPSLGNHDTVPVNLFDPNNATYISQLHAIGSLWSKWLTPDALKQFLVAGYYTMSFSSSLRIVSLNTNLWSTLNTLISPQDPDPGQQLAWLEQVLINATLHNEKVLLLGHVPPGGPEICLGSFFNYYPQVNDRFIDLLLEYKGVVAGSFFGHLHADLFSLVNSQCSSKARARSTASTAPPLPDDNQGEIWAAPAVVPNPYNSAVRLWMYDVNTGNLTNYHQFWSNLTEANTLGWVQYHLEYSALELLNSSTFSPAAWNAFATRLSQNSTLFDSWYAINGVQQTRPPCTTPCPQVHVCAIQNLKFDNFFLCANNTCGESAHQSTIHHHTC